MDIREDFIPSHTLRRSGQVLIEPKYIVVHDTGNDGMTAKDNVNYFKRSASALAASAHLYVDDKEVVASIPLNEKAWHVQLEEGKEIQAVLENPNDVAIGVELCYFSHDLSKSFDAYWNLVRILANLCKRYNLDPKTKIFGHEMLDLKKNDPSHALYKLGKSFPDLIHDVVIEINPSSSSAHAKKIQMQVFFPKTSDRYRPFLHYLTLLEIAYTIRSEDSFILTIQFEARSYRYIEVVSYLKEKKISYEQQLI